MATSFSPSNALDWQELIKKSSSDVPIIVSASLKNATEAVLFCSLLSRSIHLTGVKTKEHIALVKACKAQGIKITCDISPHHLFLSKDDTRVNSKLEHFLVTKQDQESLWSNLHLIDCFASDEAPFSLSSALPLLLDAVHNQKLTLADLVARLATNPSKIFNIHPPSTNTYVEIDLDEKWDGVYALNPEIYEDFASRQGFGRVRRVVIRDTLASVDGKVLIPDYIGKNINRSASKSTAAETVPVTPAFTPSNVPGTVSTPTTPVAVALVAPEHLNLSKTLSQLPTGGRLEEQGFHSGVPSSAMTYESREPAKATSWFRNQSIVSVKQFTKSTLHRVLEVAREMQVNSRRRAVPPLLQGYTIASVFYEPSTRTYLSFESATQKLGGQVLSLDPERSMASKGESLQDTIRMLGSYADMIILRHPDVGSVSQVSRLATQPIISAGDGNGEHPTQAILDIYTIIEERGTVNGQTITFIGDLKNSREVHSLAKLLTLYDVKLHFVSPPELTLPEELLRQIRESGIEAHTHTSLDDVIALTDVFYVTRFLERKNVSKESAEANSLKYQITLDVLHKAKETSILMHPLPRNQEISEEVDGDPRAVYFRQAQYGVYVRMALLALILGKIK
eukprot:c21448_g1_i11.p1 GENE.c21448_g1_i11~~c21448_g1_i11.p1  ORF type:complete len:622 (+),score=276.69 c21448_g1_i11:68-1933(+)